MVSVTITHELSFLVSEELSKLLEFCANESSSNNSFSTSNA